MGVHNALNRGRGVVGTGLGGYVCKSDERIEGTENGKPLALPQSEHHPIAAEKDFNLSELSFPLEVGKQWSFVNDYVFNDPTSDSARS